MEHPSFPLVVHADERPVLRLALRVYRDDLGHVEHRVAEVLEGVAAQVGDDERIPVVLDAAAMKVTWGALRALLNDTTRDQGDDRAHIRALLERMPSEHDIRAIDFDAELQRRG